MTNPYERHIKWWLGEFCAEDKYEWLMSLFPEFNTRLAKYAVGVYRWNMMGEIDLDKPEDVERVHTILKIINSSPGFDFFDNVFNEASPDMVSGFIGMSPKVVTEEPPFVADYNVSQIESYDDLESLKDLVGWCIVVSEEFYNDYSANGSRFYLCENDDWWDTPCQTGPNFPLDNYGLSLVAVEIGPDNHIRSITTRWNDYGTEVTEIRLKELLGDRFDMLLSITAVLPK